MKSDPIYLFQASAQKASLGVLSVAGNVCMCIVSDVSKNVNGLLLKLVLECLGDFEKVCEAKELVPKILETNKTTLQLLQVQ